MPQRTTATRAVRGGASRARDAGQAAFDRLMQSLEAAQAALGDLRKELSKGTRDVLDDLDTTLKDARKSARSVGRTVTEDLERLQHALTTGKPAGPRAARKTTAKPTAARKRTTAAKAAPTRKTTAGARRATARSAKPTAAASEQKQPAATTAESGNGSPTAEE